ncbi:MAG: SPFH/Band 7/PHB domain protein, partial [Actinomycetota bacterium]|nr:SPFH/Band 7/PHB domain protein [Actinomycetota bacterium]
FGGDPDADDGSVPWRSGGDSPLGGDLPPSSLSSAAEALAEAKRQSEAATSEATSAGTQSGLPFDPGAEAGQQPGV